MVPFVWLRYLFYKIRFPNHPFLLVMIIEPLLKMSFRQAL